MKRMKKLVAVVMLVLLVLINRTPVMASEESLVENSIEYNCSPVYERETDGRWYVIVEVHVNGEWTETFGLVFETRWSAELYRTLVTSDTFTNTILSKWRSSLNKLLGIF